jgi:hypothetical protein
MGLETQVYVMLAKRIQWNNGSVPSSSVFEFDRDASTCTHSLSTYLSYISIMTLIGRGRYVYQNAEPEMD